jgi:hypothetical protein
VYGAALAPNRGTDRTDASASRTLLPPEFPARPGDLAAAFGLVRPRTFPGQEPTHCFMQQMRIHLSGEDRVGQLHLPYRFPLQISDVDDGHETSQLLGTLLLALRLADQQIRARGAGNCSPHQQKILFAIHLHHAQILDGFAFVAHVPGEVLPGPHP